MKKILLYISDGVGCRNFIYSTFIEHAAHYGFEVVILKNVKFNFNAKGCRVVDFPPFQVPAMVDLLKTIRIEAQLNLFAKEFNNPIYLKYLFFPTNPKRLQDKIKLAIRKYKTKRTNTAKKIKAIEDQMYRASAGSQLQNALKGVLQTEKPECVMFTNQRSVTNIPIILAAEELKIPSITNIFSWDNLPKATTIHKSDFYFVWSKYMFDELKMYYPDLAAHTIRITGTPQFSSYRNTAEITPREVFFRQFGLDPQKLYICFSGDDITTSPHDEIYLSDVCNEVRKYNAANNDIYRIIFRRCPVDHSDRYNEAIRKNSDILTAIDPLWEFVDKEKWQTSYPTLEDTLMLKNVLSHCKLVVNLGSTVAIDASFFDTPACYLRYQPIAGKWQIDDIYKFIHFQTMNGLNPVFWINEKSDLQQALTKAAKDDMAAVIADAHKWAEKIILHPIEDVHKRMWQEITAIAKSRK